MNVLWLASWFPNRKDHFSGDFTERHAKAVAPFADRLTIITIIKDDALPNGKVEIEKKQEGNICTCTVYYGRGKYSALFEKIYSFRKYMELQRTIFKQLVTEQGMPDLVHVHVAMKAGSFAKELKKKYSIPYIVTEHWTGYYRSCSPNLYDMGKIYRALNNSVLNHATLLLPVSGHLGKTIAENFAATPYKAIPNVVDTGLFFYKPSPPGPFRFIHPSYMNYQKNPEGILQACKLLAAKGYNFELTLVGNDESRLQQMADETGLLNKNIFFKPAVPYATVAEMMQQSSALLLFSRFENLPCVVLEALCCGLPVISTGVGGIPEVLDEQNGIIVENENVEQLAAAMQQMIVNYNQYDRGAIAVSATAKFNYAVVGKQYADIYKDILQVNQS